MKKLLFFLALSFYTDSVFGASYPSGGGSSGTTIVNPLLSGAYQATPPNNAIPVGDTNRFFGAAYSGIISPEYSGSGSALGDLTPGYNDTWENKQKPFFIISTKQAAGVTPAACSIGTVTNLAYTFSTNGYVQVWTNAGARVAIALIDGWITNYRSANGLLSWNTNRFPIGAANATWIGQSPGISCSNVCYFMRTNGYETFVMMYVTANVPTNFLGTAQDGSPYSISYCNTSGTTEWDGFGANPFGANEYYVTVTPDSLHRDFSYFYANDISGVLFQNTGNGEPGYFMQAGRKSSDAALFPELYTSDIVPQLKRDIPWFTAYGRPVSLRNAKHPMFTGMMMTTAGSWISGQGNNWNTLITGSNDAITGPADAGASAVAWMMDQIKWESNFLTNHYGYCHPSIEGDGMQPNSWTYSDWYCWAVITAFFNANPWLDGQSDGSFPSYQTAAPFLSIGKNLNWIAANQDVTGKPPVCISLTTNNSMWYRNMSDGSKLVLFENSQGNANNFTATASWNQLGLQSNSIYYVTELITNAPITTIATNSLTWVVSPTNAIVFKLSLALPNNATTLFPTNLMQIANAPDFNAPVSFFATNNIVKFQPCTNVDISKTLYQTCIIFVTNTVPTTPRQILPPANVLTNGIPGGPFPFVTNLTKVVFETYGQKWTNMSFQPIF